MGSRVPQRGLVRSYPGQGPGAASPAADARRRVGRRAAERPTGGAASEPICRPPRRAGRSPGCWRPCCGQMMAQPGHRIPARSRACPGADPTSGPRDRLNSAEPDGEAGAGGGEPRARLTIEMGRLRPEAGLLPPTAAPRKRGR